MRGFRKIYHKGTKNAKKAEVEIILTSQLPNPSNSIRKGLAMVLHLIYFL